jgi:predicted DNA-binding helix-hairpin-helix protein
MELLQKIDLLGQAAQYDICRGCGTHSNRSRDDLGRWIYPAVRPDGKRISMLKVLQSNVCEKDCGYCANRSGRDVPRATFGPDDLARAFDQLVRAGRVQGLFLSSGVCGSVAQAMDRMLATVELIRRRYAFKGYVHLKILPGADDASIEAAVRMAHRVSVNLEAPNARRIRALSQSKDLQRDLLAPLRTAHHIRRQLDSAVSMTTQFVVGAADEPDQEILSSSAALYAHLDLARVYYSAFQPIAHTPLEDHEPTPAWREHRLYEADFLLRQYGFGLDELVFEEGNLPRRADPKTLWAWRHPEVFPLEINRATREELLRVPGIGPKSAERLVAWRRQGQVRELRQLALAGASAQRASAFVLLDGKRPTFQLPLWNEEGVVTS